ncbi:hypothetical protein EES40_22925 [Streptomyces sp. ADI93-02]|nr:hypothetical protein EES40_22925 [Streptomyces sp. ADI93-02]
MEWTHTGRQTWVTTRREWIGYSAAKRIRTCDDPRRGGRAGVVPTADSGGEESDRVSTVANDP